MLPSVQWWLGGLVKPKWIEWLHVPFLTPTVWEKPGSDIDPSLIFHNPETEGFFVVKGKQVGTTASHMLVTLALLIIRRQTTDYCRLTAETRPVPCCLAPYLVI